MSGTRDASVGFRAERAHAADEDGPARLHDEADAVREQLERELERLRARVRDLVEGSRELKKTNWELAEKCRFLEKTNESLRDLQCRKDEFMTRLVHDMKNPAGAIRQLAEILQSYDLNAKEQQSVIGDILLTSTRILQLSQDLSQILAAEVRSVAIVCRPTNVAALAEQICRMNQVLADRKQITVRCHAAAGLPEIEADPARIEDVLDNLVSNAVKFSKRESVVRVELSATSSHLTIEVIDSGPGMTAEDLQNLFQLGRAVSPRPTGGEPSTGIGLWGVRRVVEAHRGVVKVRSAPGRGSTFTVDLPLRQPRVEGDSRTQRAA